MPQLDISTYSSQLFWLVICFFSMLLIMSKLIIPKIQGIIDLRQKKIDDNLAQAEEFHNRAERAMEKYQDALNKATQKANQQIEKVQQELREVIESKTNEVSERLAKKVAMGEEAINKNKEAALKEVKKIALAVAGDIVASVGVQEISNKDIQEAISVVGVSFDE